MSKTQTQAMRVWRGAAVFDGAGEPALQAISAASTAARWRAGEMLFHRGDVVDSVIGLATGRVRLSLVTRQGRELVLRHAEPGDFRASWHFWTPPRDLPMRPRWRTPPVSCCGGWISSGWRIVSC